jgi:hypothetical protein
MRRIERRRYVTLPSAESRTPTSPQGWTTCVCVGERSLGSRGALRAGDVEDDGDCVDGGGVGDGGGGDGGGGGDRGGGGRVDGGGGGDGGAEGCDDGATEDEKGKHSQRAHGSTRPVRQV